MADTDSISAPDFGAMLEKDPGTVAEVVTQQQPEEVVTGQPRDEQGRFTKAEQEAADKAAAEAAEVTTERQPEPRIPPARLREEAEARRKAETERDEAKRLYQEDLAALRREMQSLRQPAQKPEPKPIPDLIENPEGYREFLREEARLERRKERIDETFEDARDSNPQAFDEAFTAIQQAQKAVRDEVINAANPGKALMRWHGREKALAEVGPDINGYRTRITEEARKAAMADPEFRKQVMDAMRAEAGAASRPGTNITDLPSVNRASGSAGHASNDGAVSFDSIIAEPRRR